MTKPRRRLLYHFTHVDNLPSIARDGLRCDSAVEDDDLLEVDVGDEDVKARRRRMQVPICPGGVVADYVPFYFAPRSPMLYVIHKGDVSTYEDGQKGLIYLVIDIGSIVRRTARFVFTDRNAAISYARFENRLDMLDDLVDWSLMEADYWNNTSTDPDRMARRMAEFLVHEKVPWGAFIELAARSREDAARARATLASVSAESVVRVREDWYY